MMKIYKRSDNFNAVILYQLTEIFTELNWKIEESSRFKLFCKLLMRLEKEEQHLILELTRNFLYCGLNHYPIMISKVVSEIASVIPKNIKEIIAVPLISPEDAGKVKSGSFLLYLLSPVLTEAVKVKKCKFSSIDRCSVLEKRNDRSNTLILFVDDFLGSGKTAKEALNEYDEKYKAKDDAVLVVTLVAQQIAVDLLKNRGIKSIYSHLRVRGISDSTRFTDKAYTLKLIDRIEERLKVWPDFRRGYHESEALVCLAKCPNNTFPVFWLKNKIEGEPWPAPFPNKQIMYE